MDIQTPKPEQAPQMPGFQQPKPQGHRPGHGPYVPMFVSSVIIVIAIIIGLYMYGLTVARDMVQMEIKQAMQLERERQNETATVAPMSDSDDTAAIEADLQATDVENSDSDFSKIEAELQ